MLPYMGKNSKPNIERNSYLMGRIRPVFDKVGVPKLFGIEAVEYYILAKNLKTKKIFSLYKFGRKKENGSFICSIPPGDYEILCLYDVGGKFPLIKSTNEEMTLDRYFPNKPKINGGAPVNLGNSGNMTIARPSPNLSIGVGVSYSRTEYDYSYLDYPKHRFTIDSNTYNYIGTLEFHYCKTYGDFGLVNTGLTIKDEMEETKSALKGFKFPIDQFRKIAVE